MDAVEGEREGKSRQNAGEREVVVLGDETCED